MYHCIVNTVIKCVLALSLLAFTGTAFSQQSEAEKVMESLDSWQQVWASYDLDQLSELFVQNADLSYFSSEKTGLIEGFEAVYQHHQGFGFEPGGKAHKNKLWLEKVKVTQVADEVFLVPAIWFFRVGAGDNPRVQSGPVTFLYVKESGKYKISHVHFANYADES